MPRSRFLRFLSIPAAIGLGTALVIACSDGSPVSPDQSQVGPAFKKGANKGAGKPYVKDDSSGECTTGYNLSAPPPGYESYDRNENSLVCILQL